MRQILEEHAEAGSKLSLRLFDENNTEDSTTDVAVQTYLEIKGNSKSLKFLGELLLDFSTQKRGKTFFLHPSGPGLSHFSEETDIGLYLSLED